MNRRRLKKIEMALNTSEEKVEPLVVMMNKDGSITYEGITYPNEEAYDAKFNKHHHIFMDCDKGDNQ